MNLADLIDGVAEGRRGVLVNRQRDREVWRVEERGVVWFAKRGGPRLHASFARELQALGELAIAGIGVPHVLASGRRGKHEWIVTERAPGRSLADALTSEPDPAVRRRTLAAVAQAIRELHEKGFAWPDVSADHVFVDDKRTTFIDVARAARTRVGPAERARDLGGLLFSLPYGHSTHTERVRLVRDATGTTGRELADLVHRVERDMRRRESRTRWRHRYAGAHEDVIATLRRLRGSGERTDLYEELMDVRGVEVVRELPDRTNLRFDGFFAKRYPPTASGRSPAMREREAIDRFARNGIAVCHDAAYAEDVNRGALLVVRAAPGEPLDDLLRKGVTREERRQLVAATAAIWRRMRQACLRHRDAYPCHVFAARRPDGGFDLRLIDLTRAGRAPFPRERWFVKDAAQLWYGTPRPPATRTDAVRWLRAYFAIDRLDAVAKRFARRVAAKEARIAAHQARKRAR
jgi:tRNA A-37 threonylcarbamoyl transferase component Bud32